MMTHHLLAAVVVMNAVDATFTLGWVEAGLAVEANPLMAVVLAVSPVLFMAVKLVLVNAGAWLLWQYRHHRAARIGAGFCAATYYALILFHVQHASGMAGYHMAG